MWMPKLHRRRVLTIVMIPPAISVSTLATRPNLPITKSRATTSFKNAATNTRSQEEKQSKLQFRRESQFGRRFKCEQPLWANTARNGARSVSRIYMQSAISPVNVPEKTIESRTYCLRREMTPRCLNLVTSERPDAKLDLAMWTTSITKLVSSNCKHCLTVRYNRTEIRRHHDLHYLDTKWFKCLLSNFIFSKVQWWNSTWEGRYVRQQIFPFGSHFRTAPCSSIWLTTG